MYNEQRKNISECGTLEVASEHQKQNRRGIPGVIRSSPAGHPTGSAHGRQRRQQSQPAVSPGASFRRACRSRHRGRGVPGFRNRAGAGLGGRGGGAHRGRGGLRLVFSR